MKALKINQSKDPNMWYAMFIGMIVPYEGSDDEVFWSREVLGYLNIVKREDAEVVEVSLTQPFYKAQILD